MFYIFDPSLQFIIVKESNNITPRSKLIPTVTVMNCKPLAEGLYSFDMAHKFRNGERDEIFKKFNGKCAYCGCKLTNENFQVDHIEPVFRKWSNDQLQRLDRKRGKNHIDNYNPCCAPCNASKSNLTIDKWRSEIDQKYNRILRDCSSFNLLVRFGMVKKIGKCKFYFEKFQK